MVAEHGWQAVYAARLTGGEPDYGWIAKLDVITFLAVEDPQGSGDVVQGFVYSPLSAGTSSALSPAQDVTLTGADGRPQTFLTYTRDEDYPEV